MSIWDLAKPVIAQVHGYCLAGRQRARHRLRPRLHGRGRADGLPGRALRCARHALPPVVPRHAQGDGDDAHRRLDLRHRGGPARLGQRRVPGRRARRATCSRSPSRIAMVPPELLQLNKRVVHRQMDAMGLRAGIRAGTELCALGTHTQTMREFVGADREQGPHRCAPGARRARSATTARPTGPKACRATPTRRQPTSRPDRSTTPADDRRVGYIRLDVADTGPSLARPACAGSGRSHGERLATACMPVAARTAGS